MKYEWRKQEKELYGVKTKAVLVDVPKQKFITIKGQGNPNEEDFSNRISALYSVAYGIKMLFKKAALNNEINDFTIFPLEGLWQKGDRVEFDKNDLSYILMIKQPTLITEEIYYQALEIVKQKSLMIYMKKSPLKNLKRKKRFKFYI